MEFAGAADGGKDVKVTMNGEPVKFTDCEPVIMNDRVMPVSYTHLSKVKIRIVFIFSRQISAKVCPSKIFHKYRFFLWESILV